MKETVEQQLSTTKDEFEELGLFIDNLPDFDPPKGLHGSIMAEINMTKKGWFSRLVEFFEIPRTFTVSPLRVAYIAVSLATAFWAGSFYSDNLNQQPVSLAVTENQTIFDSSGDPEANFHIGRAYLASDKTGKAIEYFSRATSLSPNNSEYVFWKGVGHWAAGDLSAEKASYNQVIESDPNHHSANLYLAHNLLNSGNFNEALIQYDKVLQIKETPEALYNKGLIYGSLGENSQEANIWRLYLEKYRIGKWPSRAANHLNELGDFSFRSHSVGDLKIVTNTDELWSESSNNSRLWLSNILAERLSSNPNLHVSLKVFAQDDDVLAKRHTKELQELISSFLPTSDFRRVEVKYFDKAEHVKVGNESQYLNNSIKIDSYTTDTNLI